MDGGKGHPPARVCKVFPASDACTWGIYINRAERSGEGECTVATRRQKQGETYRIALQPDKERRSLTEAGLTITAMMSKV